VRWSQGGVGGGAGYPKNRRPKHHGLEKENCERSESGLSSRTRDLDRGGKGSPLFGREACKVGGLTAHANLKIKKGKKFVKETPKGKTPPPTIKDDISNVRAQTSQCTSKGYKKRTKCNELRKKGQINN